jgi:hypothetical protein
MVLALNPHHDAPASQEWRPKERSLAFAALARYLTRAQAEGARFVDRRFPVILSCRFAEVHCS